MGRQQAAFQGVQNVGSTLQFFTVRTNNTSSFFKAHRLFSWLKSEHCIYWWRKKSLASRSPGRPCFGCHLIPISRRPYRTEIWSPQRPGAPGTCTGRRSEQSQCVFTELPSTQLKHLLDYMLISFDSVRAEEISLLRGLRLLPPPALPLEHLLSGPVTQGVQYSFPHTRGEDHKRKGRGDRPEAGSREEDGLQQGWQSPKFPPRRMKSWRDKLGIVV